ncbi:hypothetical protein [Pedobacter psychroterrae]|uniref:Uncharacterized protein n=1 Tax=Pedobacter psychroterrae TaxID=2530453 RepID=A0A4R0NL95_9SPHI|nr:hypothetical protein [Pedobacter psychroterrae]TCD01396.1 hypothetical protein EZ437_11665 [Pedobacter psychroterrae]
MNSTKFILKLSFLIVPFVILSLILHDGGTSGGVGGGGYDLSGLVYGSLLFALIIIWLIWMLISYSISKTAADKKLHLRLLITGLVALIAAWFITPRMF